MNGDKADSTLDREIANKINMKPNKNILIVCDLFPPAFGPRMGYLTKYLKSEGWTVTIITEKVNDDHTFTFLTGFEDIHYIDFYQSKMIPHKLQWAFLFATEWLYNNKNRILLKEIERITMGKKFDMVLCSSFRLFPLPAATTFAQRHRLPLVIDLRDIIEQYTGIEYIGKKFSNKSGIIKQIALRFGKHCIKERNKWLPKANAVTTISPWHTQKLKQYNPNTHLIYNGYDPELFTSKILKANTFRMVYTGRVLSISMQDPSLLFKSLLQLKQKGLITPNEFHVEWYTTDDSEIRISEKASEYGVSEFMFFHRYITAEKIPSILNESSMILILTNQSGENGPKGIMPTKFFEALAVEKPILCIPSDNGCLAQAIEETKSGLAGNSIDEVSSFITTYLNQWKEKQSTNINSNREEVEKYSRKKQALQFIALFDQIIQSHGTTH